MKRKSYKRQALEAHETQSVTEDEGLEQRKKIVILDFFNDDFKKKIIIIPD